MFLLIYLALIGLRINTVCYTGYLLFCFHIWNIEKKTVEFRERLVHKLRTFRRFYLKIFAFSLNFSYLLSPKEQPRLFVLVTFLPFPGVLAM